MGEGRERDKDTKGTEERNKNKHFWWHGNLSPRICAGLVT
jgi:hypothetical protein